MLTLLTPGPPVANHGLGETKLRFLGKQDREGFRLGILHSWVFMKDNLLIYNGLYLLELP